MNAPTVSPAVWIEHKKQGGIHAREDIHALVQAVMHGHMKDYQLAAWLMAVCWQGLNEEETFALTEAFVQSGSVLDFKAQGITGVIVDKHSTGGVGDKVTLILSPLLAACGVTVAKLSGRGLGITGGTVDKLEAIPGFKVERNEHEFFEQAKSIGLVLSSQTASLAPADGVFYALRDVTATVDNLSLIAASVVSKKIASGADVVVLDVKFGKGAFMKTQPDAEALARVCARIGERFGRKMHTLLSRMEAPLGRAIGHTVEVVEAIETLKGQGAPDVEALCLHLAAVSLVHAGLFTSEHEAHQHAQACLYDGKALAAFRDMIRAQGGDERVIEQPERMPQPQRIIPVFAEQSGYVAHIHALEVARAVKRMGGGRVNKTDALDLGVGVVLRKQVGDVVFPGDVLFELWASTHEADEARQQVLSAFTYSKLPIQAPPLYYDV
jgi:pyrimidine-nucleoside phosphorylase